ncbi:MAG: hypothetical protein ACSLFQ_23825 [Thermoanaerobaculia bacterium]
MNENIDQLNSATFDDFLRVANPFANGQTSLDLRDVRFISSGALVQLAAASHGIAARSGRPTICVENANVRTYLVRSGFVAAVAREAQFDPAFEENVLHQFDHLHGSNPMLLEVTKIETGSSLPPLLDRIVALLRTKLQYRKPDAFDLATVISEVAQNTFDHNSQTCGFLALQAYKPRRGRRFVEIGIADFGAGLRATLERNPDAAQWIKSDTDAIAIATRLGMSQHQDATRGTGLHHLLRVAVRGGGSVHIRSGTGKIVYRGDRNQGYRFTVPAMPGVQVVISVPTRTS